MPKIPTYDQQALASSLVGTPGMDNSGAAATQGIASAAEEVGGAVMQYRAELRNLELTQIAQNNAMEVADYQFNTDTALDRKMRELKDTYTSDPDRAVAEFEKYGKDFIDEFKGRIGTPAVKSAYYAQSMGRFREQLGSMRTSWAGEQRIKANIGKFESISDSMQVAMGKTINPNEDMQLRGTTTTQKPSAMSVDEALGTLYKYGNAASAYEPIYGDKLPAIVRANQEKGAINYLNTLAYTNPDQLEQVIKDGVFDDFIDGASRNEIYQKAKSYAREQKTLELEEQKLAIAQSNMDISQKEEALRRSDASAADFDALADEAAKTGQSAARVNSIRAQGTAQQRRLEAKEKSATREAKVEERRKQRETEDVAKGKATTRVNSLTTEFKTLEAGAGDLGKGTNGLDFLNRMTSFYDKLDAADKQYEQAHGFTSPKIAAMKGKLSAYMVGIKNTKQLKRQFEEYNSFQKQTPPGRFSNNAQTNAYWTNLYYRGLANTYAAYKKAGKDPTTAENRTKIRQLLLNDIQTRMRTTR